jgi:ABC-type uncharacterized transport system substrate-binding protein
MKSLSDAFPNWVLLQVLRSDKTGDIPMEQPPIFELVINLQTAKALAITIPQLLILRADRVIK